MALKPGKYNSLKPDIELFDFKSKKRFGLKLEGSGALQIGTISQDDSVHVRAAGKRVGDFDEQRSWKGGRGTDKLSDNAEGYWDSMNAWTMTDGHLHQTLLWQFARGIRACDFVMPTSINPNTSTSVTWKALLGASLYLSMSWNSMGVTADYVRLWIRRVGSPQDLTVSLYTDSSGSPGSLLVTKTIAASDVADTISVLQLFDFDGTQALTATTKYHVLATGDSLDNKNNHWEVGGDSTGTTGKQSSSGSSYAVANFDMYFYVANADIARTFYAFFLDSAMYVVDKKDNTGITSQIWINGDRGKATAGTSSTLTHTGKTWETDQWSFARVKIVRGAGAGQTRLVTTNSATVLTVSSAWTINPSTDSEYIIYSTPWFTEITGHALGRVVSQPVVVNQIVYFPQGEGDPVRNMIWNATTVAHVFGDDGTNVADFMVSNSDQNGIYVYRGRNKTGTSQKTASRAPASAYSGTPAALVYETEKNIGDSTYTITNMLEREGVVYIFKENGMWLWSGNTIVKTQTGIDKVPSEDNGRAVTAHQQFIYYSWLHSLVRVYGSSHDDVGQDWSGYGLPQGREGVFSSLDSYTSLLMGAVDAGTTGTSSVLGFDGLGWHEIVRAYDTGKRIRMIKLQPIEDGRNMLWTEMGGDFVYQRMPFKKGSPRLDTGIRYMHEAVIESSAIDMGTASGLPKFIKELSVYCENLGDGNEIRVDYQVDDDVHTSNWTDATTLLESPESTAFLGLSNVRKFAYRLRINSSNNRLPVDILGVIPNGYARSPYKMVWTLRCKADNITSRGRLVKPDILMRWLLDNARYPGRIEMLSQYELAHKFFVIIHPPRMFPYKPSQNGQAEESVFTIVLEEI